MAYYSKMNINGVEFLLAVNIVGSGAPNASTQANVGMFYMNYDDGSVYKCVGAGVWEPIVSTEQIATAVANYLVENPVAKGEDGGYYIPSLSGGTLMFSPSNANMRPIGSVGNVKGEDGVSPTVSVREITGGHEIVITDANGSETVAVMDGNNGNDGVSPTVSVAKITGGHRITINDKNGAKTVDVLDGLKGDNGKGISSIARTSGNGAAGTTDTYTITYTDNTTSTFSVYNGKNGTDGKNGTSVETWWQGTILYVKSASGESFANLKGADGTSVTVSSVNESTADGGTNVVTFSDGKTLNVKNGSKGSKGDKGATGATGATGAQGPKGDKGDPYTLTASDKQEIKNDILSSIITQEAGESESLVMSQKAATDLVAEAIGTGGGTTEYETVDSVEEMTDTSKQYVLKETGTIWAYGSFTEEKEPENKFVPSTATLNARHGSSSTSALDGYFVTDYIKVDKFTEVDPYIMRVFKSEGVGFTFDMGGQDTGFALQRIHYFDANKTLIANKYLILKGAGTSYTTGYTDSNGNVYFHIDECMSINGTYNPNNIIEIPDFDHSLVKYVRVTLAINGTKTAITANDVANVIITFDADGGTVTTNKWYDTGMRPSTGGGGNYVDLLVKVNQNKTDIAEVSSRVTALETGSSSVTIPSFWKNAVDTCVAKIKALQVGRNCVTFPFFSDNHQRNGYVGMLIAHIMKECGIPYAFFGGDTIDSGYIASEAVMVAQDKAFDETMSYIPSGRFCRAVGNHDGYWAVSASEKHMYTREQIYDLFLREEGLSQNKHFGEDGTYYYIDDIVSKVRFIVLNTNKISLAETSGSIDSTQLAWLQSTALKFSENGWGVVIFSHFPITNHYHSRVLNATEVVSVVNNANVDIIGWFSGHIHRDRIYTHFAVGSADGVEGTNGIPLGFTQVTITSDHTGIAYDDATKHTIANDDQSHAIDFVTINKATRTVNITRLGIGEDRSYTY